MKLVVTIFEPTPDAAIAAIRELTLDHDAIELRVDPFGRDTIDLRAVRAATVKPVIVTNRGGAPVDFATAYEAGIDYVDVELGYDVGPRPDRVVYSHHDYESTPDVTALLREMLGAGCAQTKIAATPRNYDDNVRLLEALYGGGRPRPHAGEARAATPGLTVIGMGERGLYSRIAAPFLGSELQFVARDQLRVAAPGQLTLEDALLIYGTHREPLRADQLFAIAGNPAAHSHSPMIHNPLFREHGIAAAYTIASFATFLEIAEPFARGDRFAPRGLSVTAPFKEEAFAFAQRIGGDIAENARDCGAVNTLVRIGNRIVADNTDVDGFLALTPRAARRAAIVGAGGTSRAARVALQRLGIATTIFNRTPREGSRPLGELAQFDGDLIINTLPAGADVDVDLRPGATYIEAQYGAPPRATPCIDGLALLEAQAIRQNELFRQAAGVSS